MDLNTFSLLIGVLCLMFGFNFALSAKDRIYRTKTGTYFELPYVLYVVLTLIFLAVGFSGTMYWFLSDEVKHAYIWETMLASFILSVISTVVVCYVIPTRRIQEDEDEEEESDG
ncbi:MAG: hypothetical protein JSW41_06000 [Candidatus Aenigmatarchaeota archaeon]|nr:MAG: hypothetical protein JSW41_06000 [Candidatus Aenigmarchaeota archaeon]